MFGHRFRLLRLAGIPVSLDASWLIILVLVTWTLINLFQQTVPDLAAPSYLVMGLIAALAFFTCILLHELGHAVVARATGTPVRGINLFLFGGVSELEGEPSSAGREFVMAIAGPAVSAVLAVLFAILAGAGELAGWAAPLVAVLGYLAWINLMLLVFNLIPAFPLDGGRVLRSMLWAITGSLQKATRWASALGQGFAWLLIAFGVLQFISGDVVQGLWMGLIGLFLNSAAQASYRQIVIRQALQGEPVARFMTVHPVTVPSTLDLRNFVEDYVYRFHRKTFPVVDDSGLVGIIQTSALADIPRQSWDSHTVAEVMNRDWQALSMPPDADAMTALEIMQRTGASRLLVVDSGRLQGIVSLKDLLRFLDLKLELDGGEPGRQPPSGDAKGAPPPQRRSA